MLLRKIAITIVCCLALFNIAQAVPQTITFQGRLTESNIPVEGTRYLRFEIVRVTNPSTPIWISHASLGTPLVLSQGIYTVDLGDTNLNNMNTLSFSTLDVPEKLLLRVWVGIAENSLTELTPAIPINAAPYAYWSANATTANYSNNANIANQLAQMGAASGQVLKWNGSAWAPAADTDTNTTYTAGTGLTLNGTVFSSTVADTNTTYNAGTGLSLSGTVFSHAAHTGDVTGTTTLTIGAGRILSTMITDNAITSTKIADAAVATRNLSQMGAASGQVLKWNGSAWAPAADNNTTYSNLAYTNAANTFTVAQTISNNLIVTGNTVGLTISNGATTNRTLQVIPSSNAGVIEFIY